MKRKRLSLKDIVQEDKNIGENKESENVADAQEVPAPVAAAATILRKEKKRDVPKKDIGNNISDKIISKSEFVKMSITIEPDLFEDVDEMSRQRRRRKEPYSYSVIIRDALREYFANNK